MEKLHQYLLQIREGVLSKNPGRTGGAVCAESRGRADALPGKRRSLETDKGAPGRANLDNATGRENRTFFGSDYGGKTAAVW
jgi:hypothetical protein